MHMKYIGPFQADMNEQSSTAKLEFRVEPSEAYDGHLAIGVNSYKSGKEFILAHLTREQVENLREAIEEYLQ